MRGLVTVPMLRSSAACADVQGGDEWGGLLGRQAVGARWLITRRSFDASGSPAGVAAGHARRSGSSGLCSMHLCDGRGR